MIACCEQGARPLRRPNLAAEEPRTIRVPRFDNRQMMNEIRHEDLIALDVMGDDDLRQFLAEQNISLKANELVRIRQLLGRNPSIVELHIFNVMWSEHCSYKSSKVLLRRHLPVDAPHVVLGPGEDAGIIRFFEKDAKWYCVVLAHESHNHPSQVLPVEGAATGIGGIVRDVYCMGADVIGVMDPLRFGDPDGPHAKRVGDIVRGVVEGIAQYGNALGVPNLGGETYFDRSFDDNCLVNVIAIGVVVEEDIIRSRAPDTAVRAEHDVILIGKPTDASGFGGAAFASERLSGESAEERQEAVQVPDPFLKRVLTEATKTVLAEAKRKSVGIGFKDLGAGGISCAISEMAHSGGVGATVDLDRVNQASTSLPDEVIACSETQERYAVIVPKEFSGRVCEIYNEEFELPHIYNGAGAVVIGHTTTDRRFRLASKGRLVCDADVSVITTGIEYEREAKPRSGTGSIGGTISTNDRPGTKEALMELLSSYNIANKSILWEHYDAEVQARAVLRPGEADAAVSILVPGEPVGVASSVGSASALGEVDPFLGGVWAVCEAVRNVACVGALPLAITDCLNFGDPEDPEVFWDFSEAVRGIGEACRGLKVFESLDHGIPVVSGNVSFYNQSGSGRPIAPSPIVACVGRVDEVSQCRSLGFKMVGSRVVLLGRLHECLAASEYARRFLPGLGLQPPVVDLAEETRLIQGLLGAYACGGVLAAHDVSHGGILVALVEMMLGSGGLRIGCRVRTDDVGSGAVSELPLFAEYTGVLIEVEDSLWDRVRGVLDTRGVPFQDLGTTQEHPVLEVRAGDDIVTIEFEEADRTHRVLSRCNKLFA